MSDIQKNYEDENGNSHPGIEAMEANQDYYCVRIKLKPLENHKDWWIVCFANPDL